MSIIDSFRADYRSTLKSSDTEENIDLFFYRPIGFAWALLFRKLHITPNIVTIASIFIGVAAGVCLFPDDLPVNAAGILLLVIANSLDSADGQLARLTGQYSRLGRILDGMAGDLWFLSIYIAICLRTIHSGGFPAGHPVTVWTIAVAAGICHARQAAMADYFRQFHLMFVKKNFPTEFEDSSAILSQYRGTAWSRLPQKIALGAYYLYTLSQERATPKMQTLIRKLHNDHPSGDIPARLSERLRAATLPLCRWENFMTFNWRSITLSIAILTGQPAWYFIVELTVFNAVLVYVLITHEKICESFL